MRKLGLLLKVQLLGMFGINRVLHAGNARDKGRLLGLGVLLVAVGAMAAAYAYGMAVSLVALGAADAVPVVALAAGSLAGVFATLLKANGTLFGFKDFDLTASLPVPLWQVALSRVAAVYGMNLLWAALLMIPLFAAALPALGVGALGWALALASVLLAPVAPMALAVAVSFVLTAVASRLRHGRVVAGVLGMAAAIALTVALVAASGGTTLAPGPGVVPASGIDASVQGDLASLGAAGIALRESVGSFWPPAAWAASGIAEGNMAAFALFASVSLAAGVGVTALLGRFLVPINSLLSAGGSGRRALAEGAFRRRSALGAMVRKELRAVIGTPAWLMNTVIGPVLALVLGIAFLVAGPGASSLLTAGIHGPGISAADLQPLVTALLTAVVPWALAFCVAIGSTSAAALSLEGDARWIMQTAPQTSAALMGAKMLAYVVLAGPAAVAGGLLAAVGLRVGVLEGMAFAAVPLSAALLAAALGAFLNGRMPRYDWTSEYEVVKRSAPVALTVLAGIAVAALGGIASVVVPGWVGSGMPAMLEGAGDATALVQLGMAALIALAAGCLARGAMRTDLRE